MSTTMQSELECNRPPDTQDDGGSRPDIGDAAGPGPGRAHVRMSEPTAPHANESQSGAKPLGYRMPRRAVVPKVDTPAVIEAINKIFDAYSDGGFACVSGIAGSGKTTMTEILVQRVQDWYDPTDPETCTAVRYEVGKADPRDRIAMKRVCLSLHTEIGGRLDEGYARRADDKDVALLIVQELKLRGIGIVVLDEAGGLTVDAIRGLMLVLNVARRLNHPLLIVLVGMDDLPKTLKKLPQISRRVTGWVFFEPYKQVDTYNFLTKVHPHFESLDRGDPSQWAQVEFIHRISAGLPGHIVPFLNKVDRSMRALDHTRIDLQLLKTVYTIRHDDEIAAVNASGFGMVASLRARGSAGESSAPNPKEKGK